MVCLRLRGRKGRSNRCPITALQQRHWPPDMATVEQNDTGISSSSVVKTEMAAGTDKRFKFLCSYGGKILPQPSDGQLKYVGGETRVICVPRSISFLDLNKKVEDLFNVGEIVIKFRIMNEDLDTLVSIRCNDDLVHMWDEYDRLMSLGSPTTSAPRFLRLFLFLSSKCLSLSRPRNYLDAINGQQMDPALTCHLEPSRDYHHAETLSFCPVDDPTEHRAEWPGSTCVALSPRPKQFQRVWSTPNLQGAHRAGGDRADLSSRMQCGLYRNHVQLMGHSHQQACGRSDTCRCGNVCAYPQPKIERSPIRVPSYQNLNLACQAGSVVSDRGRSNLVQSPRTIGNGVQNSIPNNLTNSNILQSAIANSVSMHKPMQNATCVQNPIPNGSSDQNLIQNYTAYAGAFGSVGTMCTQHVPLEVGSSIYMQQPRSGTTTLVRRQSRAGTPVSEAC